MWFGLINEIKAWYTRLFITRNCWMPEGDLSLTSTWNEEEENEEEENE